MAWDVGTTVATTAETTAGIGATTGGTAGTDPDQPWLPGAAATVAVPSVKPGAPPVAPIERLGPERSCEGRGQVGE